MIRTTVVILVRTTMWFNNSIRAPSIILSQGFGSLIRAEYQNIHKVTPYMLYVVKAYFGDLQLWCHYGQNHNCGPEPQLWSRTTIVVWTTIVVQNTIVVQTIVVQNHNCGLDHNCGPIVVLDHNGNTNIYYN